MNEIQLKHHNNKIILEKAGFIIKQYINTPYKLVLYAYHQDGRKVEIVA